MTREEEIKIEDEILNGISGKNPEIFEYPCKLDPPALLKVWEGTVRGCACFSCERDNTILLNHDQVDALIIQLQEIQSKK